MHRLEVIVFLATRNVKAKPHLSKKLKQVSKIGGKKNKGK